MLIPWQRVHHLLDDVHQSFFSPSPSLFLTSNFEGVSPHYPRWRDEGDVASLSLEVPGLAEDSIEVRLDADTLIVEGTSEPSLPEGYTLRRKERVAGSFRHAFTLDRSWDPETLTACLQDGMLSIRISKTTKPSARQIPLSTQHAEANDA